MFAKKTEGENDPTVGDYGLFKIPAEVLLKQARIEIGQLKSYIAELEDLKLKYRKKVLECYEEINRLKREPPIPEDKACAIVREVKREELYTVMREQNKNLSLKIRQYKKDNESLMEKIIKFQCILIEHGIDTKLK